MREIDRPSYPGLNFISTVLWREWLKLYEPAFTGFDYNVRVGQGIAPPANATPEQAAVWKAVTQKRIDVVASRSGQTWIIEIDERPGMRVMGQLRLYTFMAPKYLDIQGKLVSALICRFLGFDTFGAFRQHGDLIFKFPLGRAPQVPPSFLPPGPAPNVQLITESFREPTS